MADYECGGIARGRATSLLFYIGCEAGGPLLGLLLAAGAFEVSKEPIVSATLASASAWVIRPNVLNEIPSLNILPTTNQPPQ